MAEAIANAILSYKKDVYGSGDVEVAKPSQKIETIKINSQATTKPVVKTPEIKKLEPKPEPKPEPKVVPVKEKAKPKVEKVVVKKPKVEDIKRTKKEPTIAVCCFRN